MNDRFKFRIFYSNKMVYPNDYQNIESIYECLKQQIMWDCAIDVDFKFNHIANNLIFMQCTGLKDKNGTLIYEGDILKGEKEMIASPHSSILIDKIGVVEIPEETFIASCRDIKQNCTLFCQCEWQKTEVIGNIYENKELLGG